MSAGQERTEQATPRRKLRARNEGQSARSELAAAALGLCAAIAPAAAASSFGAWWIGFFRAGTRAGSAAVHDGTATLLAFGAGALHPGPAWAPIAAASGAQAAAAVVAALVCGGIGVSLAPLRLRWERLSWSAGAKRIFSAQGALSAAVGGACIVLIGLAARPALAAVAAAAALGLPFPALAALSAAAGLALWSHAVPAITLVAAVDIAWQRARFAAQLRMAPREVRDERIELEGKPEIKARRRALGARRTRSLSIAAIARATAVVTNPTHVAVALRYAPPALDVPVVVARGAGQAATLVRAAARAHDVPIIESPELARLLYRRADVDEAIPQECYAAVAAVFAWILRTRGRLGGPADEEPA